MVLTVPMLEVLAVCGSAVLQCSQMQVGCEATIAGGGVIPNINQSLFPDVRLREDETYKAMHTQFHQFMRT